MSLPLSKYRDLIRLDDVFLAAPPLLPEQRLEAVAKLLAYFSAESGHKIEQSAGLNVLRALLTIRPAMAIAPDEARLLDALLQSFVLDRCGPKVSELAVMSETFSSSSFTAAARCSLWRGDITTLQADAIVNAANAQLLGCFQPFHACIDNAIHWFAGPQLRQDCARLMSLEARAEASGEAKITRAFNLPSRFVLHTVGPIVQGELTAVHRRQLADSYHACLRLAHEMTNIRTIAFCGISTGVFGFPKDAAARIALQVLETWFDGYTGPIEKVVINVFSEEDEQVYRRILEEKR